MKQQTLADLHRAYKYKITGDGAPANVEAHLQAVSRMIQRMPVSNIHTVAASPQKP